MGKFKNWLFLALEQPKVKTSNRSNNHDVENVIAEHIINWRHPSNKGVTIKFSENLILVGKENIITVL